MVIFDYLQIFLGYSGVFFMLYLSSLTYGWMQKQKRIDRLMIAGGMMSAITVIAMLIPVQMASPMLLDGKLIILAVAGVFFGYIPALMVSAAGILFSVLSGRYLLFPLVFSLITGAFFSGAFSRRFLNWDFKKQQYFLLVPAFFLPLETAFWYFFFHALPEKSEISIYFWSVLLLLPLGIYCACRLIMYLLRHHDNEEKLEAMNRELESKNQELYSAYDKLMDVEEKLRTECDELADSEKRLGYLAYYDDLTGLPNRNRVEEILEEYLNDDRPGVIVCVNVDNFRSCSDIFGFDTSADLMKQTAKRLECLLDKEKTIACLGNDIFAFIINGKCTEQDVVAFCAEVKKIFQPAFISGDHELCLTVSMGVAYFPMEGDTAGKILMKGTTALSRAKLGGQNRIVVFNQEMGDEIHSEMQLEEQLRHSVERNELEIHYQPQYDLKKKIVGLEALVRWNRPHCGLVAPGDFIHVAEKTGVIVEIGEWVLRQSCLFAKKINDGRKDGLIVSVNISGVQLMQAGFLDQVKSILAETGIDPALIGFEITETVLMESLEQGISAIISLRDMGIHVSLDDFGTGYSSLNYLRRIPATLLKIDRSFIAEVHSDSRHEQLTRMIIDMAHGLGLNVVAEGVETSEQLDLLSGYDCDMIQGFLFSCPLTEEDIMEII